jgi:AcrR family transcriptional regulator
MPEEVSRETKPTRRAATRAAGSTRAGDRSAASREALLAAARDLFTTRGYAATNMADIVARAGTSVGLPYYYFGSKKKIFHALWSDYQAKQEARTRMAIAAARTAGETDGGRLLLLAMRAYLEGAWEASDMVPMMHGHDRPSGFDSVTEETNKRWRKRNSTLLVGQDPVTAQVINVILLSSLGGICTELASCRTEARAQQVIERAMHLWTGMIERSRADTLSL